MSIKPKVLKKEDLQKFDYFIQDTLDKYIDVKIWDELIQKAGNNSKEIISNKSTIPDLVIYNKGFNKRDCFYYSNKKGGNIYFPRTQFILRPKKVKEYNITSPYIIMDTNENNNKEKENEQPFEFKSIPKELEKKYVKNNEEEKNELINELNDFLKTDNDTVPKVNLIKEDIPSNEFDVKVKEDENKYGYRKYSYKENSMNINNKFSGPNNISQIDYRKKMIQNMQFNELLYKNMLKVKLNNKFNNGNYALNGINQNIILSPDNYKNNEININFPKDNINSLNYYANNYVNELKGMEYIEKLNYIMMNNITERIWVVVNEKNSFVHKYNNEELYYFLNVVVKNGDYKNNSIYCSLYPDLFISPTELYENLKLMYQKK